MPGDGNRAWSLAGVPLTLIAGPSGNAVSPHLSGQPTGQEIADPLLHQTKPGSPEVLRVDYVYPKKC